MRICKVDGCEGKHKGHGYCQKHNLQLRKHGEAGVDKEIRDFSICKNPQCSEKFKVLHRRHFFCCDRCKNAYHGHTEKRKETIAKYNQTEKATARTKRFLATEKGKIYNRGKAQRQRARYPKRCKTRIIANKYLEKGKPCIICNLPGERHHPDYTKPLEVIFLCKKHHAGLHKRLSLAI